MANSNAPLNSSLLTTHYSLPPSGGFSLLGVLLATIILAAGGIAISQLIARTHQVTGISRETFIATSLAREGLELVQAVRDTNWFQGRNDPRHWTASLCDSNQGIGSGNSSEFALDAATVRNSLFVTVIPADRSRLYLKSNLEWVHAPDGQATPYSRTITVDCTNKDGENDPNEIASIAVTSRVFWERDGKEQEYTVKETLYNWLPVQPEESGTSNQ